MLIDHYPTEDVFARVPELADQADPVLVQLDRLLEDDLLFQQVRADLLRRYRLTAVHGRHSTPTEAILRLLVVRRLYGWSFEETEKRVADSLVLRWFCRVYFRRVPDDTTLLRWAHTLQPETLHALIARAAQLAGQLRVTPARKLRVDGTVVETTIHYPTDSRRYGRRGPGADPAGPAGSAAGGRAVGWGARGLPTAHAVDAAHAPGPLSAGPPPERSGGPSGSRAASPALHQADPDHRANAPSSPASPTGAHAGGSRTSATPATSCPGGTARGFAGSLPRPSWSRWCARRAHGCWRGAKCPPRRRS